MDQALRPRGQGTRPLNAAKFVMPPVENPYFTGSNHPAHNAPLGAAIHARYLTGDVPRLIG